MISQKKIEIEKEIVIAGCKNCKGKGCPTCFGYMAFIDKMAVADIPVDYWRRDMQKFYGDTNFKSAVLDYIDNIDDRFAEGASFCFVGHPGTGKTMAACAILKAGLLGEYTAMYTTMIEATTKLMSNEAARFRNYIKYFDFFVIDEVDPRFFPSDASKDLHGNHFENILRTRAQNKLPTIICTNSEDTDQIFVGEFQRTFSSLKSQFVKILRAGGKDARTNKERL